jgi:hypothetical protein
MKKNFLFLVLTVFSLGTLAQVPNYIPQDGLIGWWPFNGNANDESGNGFNGTSINSSYETDRFGATSSAAKFENTVASYISTNIGIQDTLSFSLWYSCASQTKYYPTLLDYGNSVNASLPVTRYRVHIAGQEPSWINTFTGRAYIQTNVGGDGGVADSEITSDSEWHNLICVFVPNDAAYLYVDGELIGQDDLSNSQVYSGSLYFGRDVNDDAGACSACGRYNGLLDDIAVWNRALTPSEISSIFLSQEPCSPISSITLTAESVEGEVPFVGVGYLPNAQAQIADQSQWHYVAVTKAGSNGSLYFDGNLVTAGTFESNPYIWNSLLLGATQACVSCSPVPNFDGQIDEVRVSNIARSSSSISNHYLSNQPFTTDANTIGLFHLDNINGSNIPNAIGGNASLFGTPTLTTGKFGQALDFDGLTDYVRWTNSIPVNNMTLEFWYKSSAPTGTIAMLEFAYNTGINLGTMVTEMPVLWSNGQTGNSVTVDPSTLPFIAVDNGACSDTIFFNSISATVYDTVTTNVTVFDTVYTNITVYDTIYTNVTVYDTLYTNVTVYDTVYISVTDTLIIEVPTGLEEPNAFGEWLVYPNPTSDELTIDFGVVSLFDGFSIQIINSMGQIVFMSNVVNQFAVVDVSTWSSGTYVIAVLNETGTEVQTKTLIIQ